MRTDLKICYFFAFLFLLWFPWDVFAKPPILNGSVQLNFYRVEIAELSHLVYGEILQQDYLIAPDVIANAKPVSIKLGADKKALAAVYGSRRKSMRCPPATKTALRLVWRLACSMASSVCRLAVLPIPAMTPSASKPAQ